MTNALASQYPSGEPSFMHALDLDAMNVPEFSEYVNSAHTPNKHTHGGEEIGQREGGRRACHEFAATTVPLRHRQKEKNRHGVGSRVRVVASLEPPRHRHHCVHAGCRRCDALEGREVALEGWPPGALLLRTSRRRASSLPPLTGQVASPWSPSWVLLLVRKGRCLVTSRRAWALLLRARHHRSWVVAVMGTVKGGRGRAVVLAVGVSMAVRSCRCPTSCNRGCLLSCMAAEEVVEAAGTTTGATGYFCRRRKSMPNCYYQKFGPLSLFRIY
ncbi:uncharacterized protein LOC110266777 [Arachis ipaensis]|uniref:uncharacterized protein LOC110266777 n=1 Tax=Arachis ipaensis TaxID=130454 RepID=UPI000A2B0461|nr:uncharacterized protein LOC110266777 [Arachis ipaensis]